MFRQHHPRIDTERMCLPDPADNLTKQINLTYQKIIAMPFQQVDGKKPCATGNKGATIAGHIPFAI